MMLSRVADALFWMGRYLERAEHVARVLEVTRAVLIDLDQVDPETAKNQWQGALAALSLPDSPTEKLLYDQTESTSLVACISRARENARQVREVISTDMWEHLNQAYWSIHEAHARGVHESQLSQALKDVVSASFQWDGVADGTTSRDEGWLFLKIGKFVERIDGTARFISVRAEGPPRPSTPSSENVHWIALLRCLCSGEAYKKLHPQRVDKRNVLDFLLLDEEFPRSLRYATLSASDFAGRLAAQHGVRGKNMERAFGKLASRLEYTNVDEIEKQGTSEFLKELLTELDSAGGLLQRSYFLQ
jgi:uncharacterized alpha-E superfamily protein